MKNILITIVLLSQFLLNACKEKEQVQTITKGPTTIEGRVFEINSDLPAPNVDVYLWKYADRMGNIRELVDETITDSNGNYSLKFDVDRTVYVSANFHRTGYISYKHVIDPTYTLDGKKHQHNIEMIPPAWVNVRIKDIEAKKDYDFLAVGTQFNSVQFANSWNVDTIVTMKVYGNMVDTVALGYYKSVPGQGKDIELQIIKYPIIVPGFQFKDLLIEY